MRARSACGPPRPGWTRQAGSRQSGRSRRRTGVEREEPVVLDRPPSPDARRRARAGQSTRGRAAHRRVTASVPDQLRGNVGRPVDVDHHDDGGGRHRASEQAADRPESLFEDVGRQGQADRTSDPVSDIQGVGATRCWSFSRAWRRGRRQRCQPRPELISARGQKVRPSPRRHRPRTERTQIG